MPNDLLDKSIFDLVREKALVLESYWEADLILYNGSIHPNYFRTFRDFVESIKSNSNGKDKNRISVFLKTFGGSAETAEKMVNVLRQNYEEVYFIVPDFAMSAGTILCMSGDKIFMDYASSLGPIDPQVPTPDTNEYVPALGYLDKVAELTSKGQLDPADVVMLKGLDLAKLALFEQARDLSIDLLKEWLVNYKFRHWKQHRKREGTPQVMDEEKEKRAKNIAEALTDHKRWRSHGRSLDVKKLKKIGIEIDDYSKDDKLKTMIREFNDPLTGYIDRMGSPFFLYSKHHPNV